MPFHIDNTQVPPQKPQRTILQKETVIREKPVYMLNPTVDSLVVHHLKADIIDVPDPTIFYRPDPHICVSSYIDFSGVSFVDLKQNGNTFLSYSNSVLYTNNIAAHSGTFNEIRVSTLYVNHIRSESNNEIGGVYLHDTHLTVPGNVSIGSQLVSKESVVENGTFVNLYLENISLTQGIISADNLCIRKDANVCGVVFHEKSVTCDFGNIHCLNVDGVQLTSFDNKLLVQHGIITYGITASYANIQNIVTSTIDCSTLNIHELNMVSNVFKMSNAKIDRLEVSEIRATDYRLSDGTSIMKGMFPVGMIMLFSGMVPPRGWAECDGKSGRPRMTAPAPNVIYVIRV